MREMAKELFHLVVFLIFIMKSLDVVAAIHPPLHTGMDQPASRQPREVPGHWKKANITPVFKKGKKENLGNC